MGTPHSPSIAHTNHLIHTPQRPRQQLISQHPHRLAEPKQAMVRKHASNTQQMGVVYRLVGETREGAMSVDEVDAFAVDDGSEVR